MSELLNDKNIKDLTIDELNSLCDSLRDKIISTVMKNGGHLSSNLGVIELTVALHYVFDFPKDKLIFDVGHQCYPHKILSDRGDKFDTLRQRRGLSGFPKREESVYDCYNTGHAGTSVSAALGIAKARDVLSEDYNVIAVIGDGSFNNGLVYEAFNSLRPLNTNILVILNDNGMSISPTVGSMHEYLERLSADDEHNNKVRRHANIFERFGFSYDGVYDGNDLSVLIDKLTEIKQTLKHKSVILHLLTKKGKGYSFCEENPQQTHGITNDCGGKFVSYSDVFGKTLCECAETNEKIVAVTAAMTPSLGLSEFFTKFSDRAIDVGICEEHATILCAALATQGLKPYYAVYSTFLQRSYDELIVDICGQNLPVTICVDRAGISGEDGETHQGVFDLSFLSMIPNLTIAVPKDVEELARMIKFSTTYEAPLAIRYPREGKTAFGHSTDEILPGKWEILKQGNCGVIILACGERVITRAFEVNKLIGEYSLSATVVNARFVKPIDRQFLDSFSSAIVITLEDNQLIGGFGSLISQYYSENKQVTVKNFGYPDTFIPHGRTEQLMDEFGLNVKDIAKYIIENANR